VKVVIFLHFLNEYLNLNLSSFFGDPFFFFRQLKLFKKISKCSEWLEKKDGTPNTFKPAIFGHGNRLLYIVIIKNCFVFSFHSII